MTKHIEAPGHTALWTEAALRCLTGAAFISTSADGIGENDPPYTPEQARAIALDAMAIATAFERACEEAHGGKPTSASASTTPARFWLQCDTKQLRCDGCGSFVFRFFHDDHSSCDVCGRECMHYGGVTVLPLPPGSDAPTPTGGEERA